MSRLDYGEFDEQVSKDIDAMTNTHTPALKCTQCYGVGLLPDCPSSYTNRHAHECDKCGGTGVEPDKAGEVATPKRYFVSVIRDNDGRSTLMPEDALVDYCQEPAEFWYRESDHDRIVAALKAKLKEMEDDFSVAAETDDDLRAQLAQAEQRRVDELMAAASHANILIEQAQNEALELREHVKRLQSRYIITVTMNQALELAKQTCLAEKVNFKATNDYGDSVYNKAIEHCIGAIELLKSPTSAEGEPG